MKFGLSLVVVILTMLQFSQEEQAGLTGKDLASYCGLNPKSGKALPKRSRFKVAIAIAFQHTCFFVIRLRAHFKFCACYCFVIFALRYKYPGLN